MARTARVTRAMAEGGGGDEWSGEPLRFRSVCAARRTAISSQTESAVRLAQAWATMGAMAGKGGRRRTGKASRVQRKEASAARRSK